VITVKGENLLGAWRSPLRGVLRGLPPYALPEDALYDGFNVALREGALVPRPGITQFNPQSLGRRVTGAIAIAALGSAAFDPASFENTAFVVTTGAGSMLVAATARKVWAFYGGSWHDITGSALTAGDHDFARMTGIQIGSNIFVVISNGVDVPRSWDSVAATTSTISGSPPKWTDVTTASDRIIGIVPPYTVQWGNALDLSTWPSLNFRTLADTLDKVVAVRNLGTLGVVVYKERSIWIGQPGGQTNATYFAFTIRGFWDGPASPAAVVDVDGAHYYMTDIGRVGYFDGARQDWVADGVWPQVKKDLDQLYAKHIHGVFDPQAREVNFYYPRLGDAGLCKGLVSIKVPNKAEGLAEPIAFRGALGVAISVGLDNRTDTRQTLLFDDATKRALSINPVPGGLDDVMTFSGFWQHGFINVPSFDPHRLEGFEVFAERGPGYGLLRAKVVKNDLLEDPNAQAAVSSQDIDLAEIVPSQPRGGDVTGRFLAVRFEFTTPITLRYYGARLAARRIEPGAPLGRVA